MAWGFNSGNDSVCSLEMDLLNFILDMFFVFFSVIYLGDISLYWISYVSVSICVADISRQFSRSFWNDK